jgi:hypothetical protein
MRPNPAPVPAISSSEPEPFITVQDAAARLHVRPSTIYEWTRRRSRDEAIPHYPISKKVLLFLWSEVCEWVRAKKRAA